MKDVMEEKFRYMDTCHRTIDIPGDNSVTSWENEQWAGGDLARGCRQKLTAMKTNDKVAKSSPCAKPGKAGVC